MGSDPIVIVGGGQTAARAAQALRDAGDAGDIVVVSEELHRPYERPPLSKAVLRDAAEPALAVLDEAAFDACRITWHGGVRVERLDVDQRCVHLSDGTSLRYRQCLLATGGRARALDGLPAGAPRVHYLRTLDDARRLRSVLRAGVRLAVVGGGFLGLEAAASVQQAGGQAIVVESAPALLARFLPPEVSRWLVDDVQARGIRLCLGQSLRSVDLGAQGVQLHLGNGDLVEADEVLVAIGLQPEVAIARDAGLQVDAANGGIAVDGDCRTSDPSVFAAGDCASQFNGHLGATVRLESWQNANEQARVAACAMVGAERPAQAYPWFWTDQGPHNLQMLGTSAPDLAYVRRGDPAEANKAVWIGHRNGVPVHGIALNAGGDLRALRALFDAAAPIDPLAFADPATALRPWVKGLLAQAAVTSS
jgi:NADPH-dependent 2,4-dienoyl-CoA reductase/sulfur reductase-like enzyme